MPVTPEDVFAAATALYKQQPNGEAERRISASRSYYGFFHHANRYADGASPVPPSTMSGPTHANLSEFFSSSNKQPRERMMRFRQVGILLRQSHVARCDADYKLDKEFAQLTLDVLHRNCGKGIKVISELS